MTPDEHADLIKVASRWTRADLAKISAGIIVMELHEGTDPQVIELFKQRYQELAGVPWQPAYDAALFDAGKREH